MDDPVVDYSQALTVLPSLNSVLGAEYQDMVMAYCITDTGFLKVCRNLFPVEFAPGAVYRKMLSLWYSYYDQYRCAPDAQYETELNWALGSRQLSEEEHRDALQYCEKLSRLELGNAGYILDRLAQFALQRKWFQAGVDFTKKVRAGQLEEARGLISRSLREGYGAVLDSGIDVFAEDNVVDRVLRRNTTSPYLLRWGIEPFDRLGIGMNRGWLILGAAAEKLGKTWMGVHIAKVALLNSLNVLFCSHGDLGLDELGDRFDQCFSGALHWRKRPDNAFEVKYFKRDRRSGKHRIATGTVGVSTIADLKTVKSGVNTARSFGGRLRTKWWPMNSCTMRQFDAYLDHLASNENFFPDVIINDYPELMKMSTNDRAGIDEIYKEHKRLAGERRCVVVGFSQVNKKSYSKRTITMADFAEDKRKAAHCDGAYALCRSPAEEEQGTARFILFVDRHFGKMGYAVEIIQNYDLGQFCVGARSIPKIEDKKE